MQSDPLFEALRSVVLRVLNDRARVDYAARYPGAVVRHVPDGDGEPTQQVDVQLDDDRLGSLTGVPLAVLPGREVVLQQGTRVTVGWLGGDERYPRAFPEWDGAGGLVTGRDAPTTSWTWATPLGDFLHGLRCGHLLNGFAWSAGAAGTSAPGTVVLGPAAGVDQGEAVVSVTGGEVAGQITILTGVPDPPLAPGVVLTVYFREAFANAPLVWLLEDSQDLKPTVVVTTTYVRLSCAAPLTQATEYTFGLLVVG